MNRAQIKASIKKLHVRPSDEMYDRTLSDTLDAQQIQKKKPAARRPNMWRFIMESRATRYSAAAAAVLAAALVLLSPFGTSRNGGVVLADVAEKVRQMPTVMIEEEYLFWEVGQGEPYLEADATKLIVTKYVSEEYGVVEHVFDTDGTLRHEVFWLTGTRQFMIVGHAEKKYIEVSLPEDIFNRIARVFTPRGLVEYFTSGQYAAMGRATFNGFDVEGFETSDPNVLFPIPEPVRSAFPVADIVGRMWIDVESSLPVGIEAEFDTGRGLLTGLKKLHGQWRASDFQWNPDIPEGIFDPNIPDDYTEFKLTDFIPKEAKAGLMGLGIIPAGLIFWRRRRKKRRAVNPS
jgi:hypothetical protein